MDGAVYKVALPSLNRARLRSATIFSNTLELSVVGVVVPLKRVSKRSYGSGELGDRGIGFVSVLCFVFLFFVIIYL